jgi:glutaredoxin
MENYIKPNDKNFTIYSKSGCKNCTKVKNLLKEKNLTFNVVDCDDYILNDKINFLSFIKELSNREITSFPIVFYNKNIIGGYNETINFVDTLLCFDNI